MSALGVASVLAVLCVVCLSLAAWRNRANAHEQQALQARCNARSGLEYYLATGQLQERTLAPEQLCRVTREVSGNLVFEGQSGPVRRRLVLVGGDPARLTEVDP